MYKKIDLDDILSVDDVIELCQEREIRLASDFMLDIDFSKVAMFDMQKLESFMEKFENIPTGELETFLNNY